MLLKGEGLVRGRLHGARGSPQASNAPWASWPSALLCRNNRHRVLPLAWYSPQLMSLRLLSDLQSSQGQCSFDPDITDKGTEA